MMIIFEGRRGGGKDFSLDLFITTIVNFQSLDECLKAVWNTLNSIRFPALEATI